MQAKALLELWDKQGLLVLRPESEIICPADQKSKFSTRTKTRSLIAKLVTAEMLVKGLVKSFAYRLAFDPLASAQEAFFAGLHN